MSEDFDMGDFEMGEGFELSHEEITHIMDHYVEIGAIEVTGILTNGEFIYKITDKAEEVAPELWGMHVDAVDEAMVGLYEKGLLHVEYDEELNAKIKITEEGKEIMTQLGFIEMDNKDGELPSDQ